jgi:NitT/TauT family transport system substrate-binding protein
MRFRSVATCTSFALVLVLAVLLAGSTGCGTTKKSEKEKAANKDSDQDKTKGKVPVFKLAWSEYPSWSVFGVASELGLIDGRPGKQGALEKKWGVDIVLELLEYDPCLQAYGSKACDAVCATNIDILTQAETRKSVAIMPTSTSVGADACLVLNSVIDVADKKKAIVALRAHKVFGLAKSVSEYAFDRNLELLGQDPRKYKFTDEPPNTAATAMAGKQKDHTAIMVWNPFVLQVLKDNKDARRLFDSSTIPEEIIDMVVVAQDALDRDKGKEFACCVIDCYYEFNKLLEGADKDKLLVKLGEKFSKLGLEDMKTCVKETRFYKDDKAGVAFFTGKKLPETMKLVAKFCLDKKMIKKEASYGFGGKDKAADVDLRFDPSYIEAVRDGNK